MNSTRGNGEFVAGEWTVIPTRNLLVRGEQQLRLEPRVMDLLVYLAEHAGAVISKEELVEQVWKARSATDEVLTVSVYALRKALGDDARRPGYIETVPRRGYRWIATLQFAQEPKARKSRWHHWLIAAAAVVLLAGGCIGWLAFFHGGRHVPPVEAHAADLKGRYLLDQHSIRGLQAARSGIFNGRWLLIRWIRGACRHCRYLLGHVGFRRSRSNRDAAARNEGCLSCD